GTGPAVAGFPGSPERPRGIRRPAPCETVRRSRRRSLSRSDRPARGSPRHGTTESPARATETAPSFRQSQAGSSRRCVNGRHPFSEVFSRLPRGDAWAWAAGSSTASAIAWRDSVIIDTPVVKRYNSRNLGRPEDHRWTRRTLPTAFLFGTSFATTCDWGFSASAGPSRWWVRWSESSWARRNG